MDLKVGAGWYNGKLGEEWREGSKGLGRIARICIWDGEIRGMMGALEAAEPDRKI